MLSYLEVVVLAVLRHPLQVGVGVQQVLPALGYLGGDEGVQVGRHVTQEQRQHFYTITFKRS